MWRKFFLFFIIISASFLILNKTVIAEPESLLLSDSSSGESFKLNLDHEYEKLLHDGKKYFDLKYYTIAEKIFEKAVEIRPEDFRPYESLGFIYGIKKEVNKARQNFEQAVKLDTGDIETYLALIEIYRVSEQYSKAEKLLNRIKDLLSEQSNLKVLSIVQEIEKDLNKALHEKKIEQNPGLTNLSTVLSSLEYPKNIVKDLALRLLPLYQKTPFNQSFTPSRMKIELEYMVRFLQRDMIVDGLDGDSLSPRHVNIYTLLLNSQVHGEFFNEFSRYYRILSDENKKYVKRALQCSYKSYLGWILLTAKGFKVVPVTTFVELSNFGQMTGQQQYSGWLSKFFPKNSNVDRFTREAHASLIVKLSEDQYVFVDITNSFVSDLFSPDDYDCNMEESHCSFLAIGRNDVFSRVNLLTRISKLNPEPRPFREQVQG